MKRLHLHLPSEQATCDLARAMAPRFLADDWLLLEGVMGAGKTTFTRALVAALDGQADAVSSPSYALMNVYEARLPVWHVDAWRMQGDEDFAALGLEDMAQGGLVVVEWPSRIPALDSMRAWHLQIQSQGGDERLATLSVPRLADRNAVYADLDVCGTAIIQREDALGE
ncbi:MAG: tRNA (adenosine(37)-N6)-threonylcarbamoyltransferase complex ATPase subunit type 1 TsaE [Planctomycetota bacterium]|nr:MAG: tRNA (adenosine(37)-N6)-threonylcarbamoyltransferase complex ATPase subunit type 1 TsaE [Planctomycetota bacterium]